MVENEEDGERMNWSEGLIVAIFILLVAVILGPLGFYFYILFRDSRQKEHAVLRNFPVLGRVRYIAEKVKDIQFKRLYNAFHRVVSENANDAVQKSAERYIKALQGELFQT